MSTSDNIVSRCTQCPQQLRSFVLRNGAQPMIPIRGYFSIGSSVHRSQAAATVTSREPQDQAGRGQRELGHRPTPLSGELPSEWSLIRARHPVEKSLLGLPRVNARGRGVTSLAFAVHNYPMPHRNAARELGGSWTDGRWWTRDPGGFTLSVFTT
jgi:hypothetical protein